MDDDFWVDHKQEEFRKMKIAIMSDVHANYPALIRVLEDIKKEGCHRIYHVGDSIGIGAYPRECLDLMLGEKIRMIMGNHEYYYLAGDYKFPPGTAKGEIDHQNWVKNLLGEGYRKVVSRFPVVLKETLEGMKIGFMHYVPDPGFKNELHYKEVKKDLDEGSIDAFFQKEDWDLVIFGHQHHPIQDVVGSKTGIRYINPGALGCQRGNHAAYSILEINDHQVTIRHKKVVYDKKTALKALDLRDVPAKEYIKQIFYCEEQ